MVVVQCSLSVLARICATILAGEGMVFRRDDRRGTSFAPILERLQPQFGGRIQPSIPAGLIIMYTNLQVNNVLEECVCAAGVCC